MARWKRTDTVVDGRGDRLAKTVWKRAAFGGSARIVRLVHTRDGHEATSWLWRHDGPRYAQVHWVDSLRECLKQIRWWESVLREREAA